MEAKENIGCKQCNSRLRGRSDKLFCNSYCKSLYHNERNKVSDKLVRKVVCSLKRNRKIMSVMLENRSSLITSYPALIAKGFEFEYITHSRTNSRGKTLRFCFDFGYQINPKHTIKLIKSKNQ